MNFMTVHILGMSWSQLTNICQRGWNHQPAIIYLCIQKYKDTHVDRWINYMSDISVVSNALRVSLNKMILVYTQRACGVWRRGSTGIYSWQTALGTNVLTIQSGPKPGTIRNPFTIGLTSHGLTGIGLKSMRFASVQQLSTAITACLERPEIQQKAAMLSRQLAKEPRVAPLPRGAPKMGGPFMLVVSNMNFVFHIYIWDNSSHWLSYFSRWLEPPTTMAFF